MNDHRTTMLAAINEIRGEVAELKALTPRQLSRELNRLHKSVRGLTLQLTVFTEVSRHIQNTHTANGEALMRELLRTLDNPLSWWCEQSREDMSIQQWVDFLSEQGAD